MMVGWIDLELSMAKRSIRSIEIIVLISRNNTWKLIIQISTSLLTSFFIGFLKSLHERYLLLFNNQNSRTLGKMAKQKRLKFAYA